MALMHVVLSWATCSLDIHGMTLALVQQQKRHSVQNQQQPTITLSATRMQDYQASLAATMAQISCTFDSRFQMANMFTGKTASQAHSALQPRTKLC